MAIKDKVRTFVTTNYHVGDVAKLRDDQSLIDSGIVDSTGILEIIGFIESTFGVSVDDHEMLPENLDSIDRISGFIDRKRSEASSNASTAS